MGSTVNQNPEQIARDKIDHQLTEAGWVVQSKNETNFNEGPGIAIREYQTESGPADYVLFVDRQPIGVIEAKKEDEGYKISTVEEQSARYANSKLKHFDNQPLHFVYESTGTITRFLDRRDPKPRSREIFRFHRPKAFQEWLRKKRSLRDNLQELPGLIKNNLRYCQFNAINNLEEALKANHPRALIQMATGSGKTFTAITAIYRLLKFCGAKRILFLVDTKNLGEQAEQEFMQFTPDDDNRNFTELYNVQRLTSSFIADDSQVCISTIQRLYSILKGEELDEEAEKINPNELTQPKAPVPVVYNATIPIEFFDFIIIDECHRSIYNLWKQVLDYFDAFLIGLTATPDKRTFGFFNQKVVSEYSHEEAVADGVNVGYDIYSITTRVTKNGVKVEAKEYVDKRNRLTRKKRWTQLDEDEIYSKKQLDRDVVNPSQIRLIIKTFRDKLKEIFPDREEIPKTLVFAKTDSHADDIIHIVREEFEEGNAFCKKITYKAEENPKTVLSSFRNDYYPRIAVTVDMIATGTDVKPLECLLFMRDVKSRGYFEQMKGRGTRTLEYDALKKVTPSIRSNKTHFVIVDAIGVTQSVKTDSRSLERKRSIPFKDLMTAVMMGSSDEDTFTSLAGRLGHLEKQMNPAQKEKFKTIAYNQSINHMIRDLLGAYDEDRIEEIAEQSNPNPSDSDLQAAQNELIKTAQKPFTGKLIEYLEEIRKSYEQTIDHINQDELLNAEWDKNAVINAESTIADFKTFLEEHRDELDALTVFYNQPYQRRHITYAMLKEVLETLKQKKPALAPFRIWSAYEQLEKVTGTTPKNELTALVALIRRVCHIDQTLTAYKSTVDKNFQTWVFQKNAGPVQFTEEQMDWLRMIKDHIVHSIHFETKDLDYTPFDAKGGLAKMAQLFGDGVNELIDEINEALVA